MKKIRLLLILFIACQFSCSEDESSEPLDKEDPSILIFSATSCHVLDLFWLNNETILVADDCGTLKKISTSSKEVQLIANFAESGHLYQTGFFSDRVPGSFFYLALKKGLDGVYGSPENLYCLDLATKKVQLVADSVHYKTEGGYITGNTHLAIQKPGMGLLRVVDMQSLSVKKFSVKGTLTAFSPDDSHGLVLQYDNNKFSTFNFETQIHNSFPLIGAGTPIWRPEGLFGAEMVNVDKSPVLTYPGNLVIRELTTGEITGKIEKIINWSIPATGTLIASFVASPEFETDHKASIETFDLLTKRKKSLVTVDYIFPFTSGLIKKLTVSPDQKKIAFVYSTGMIKMILAE